MAYSKELAERVRALVLTEPDMVEKKMFGGLAYLAGGNMACGVHENELIVRVGPEGFDDAISKPGARVFDMTGKPMKGWVCVDPSAVIRDEDLAAWVSLGVDFARSLPPK